MTLFMLARAVWSCIWSTDRQQAGRLATTPPYSFTSASAAAAGAASGAAGAASMAGAGAFPPLQVPLWPPVFQSCESCEWRCVWKLGASRPRGRSRSSTAPAFHPMRSPVPDCLTLTWHSRLRRGRGAEEAGFDSSSSSSRSPPAECSPPLCSRARVPAHSDTRLSRLGARVLPPLRPSCCTKLCSPLLSLPGCLLCVLFMCHNCLWVVALEGGACRVSCERNGGRRREVLLNERAGAIKTGAAHCIHFNDEGWAEGKVTRKGMHSRGGRGHEIKCRVQRRC